MKKKSINKKLVLSKETIANLNNEKMLDVKGGLSLVLCLTYVKGCTSELPPGTVCCQNPE